MPKQVLREAARVDGPAGVLETLVEYPATVTEDTPVAVIAHPHPAHGGAMTNKVVATLARAFNLCGHVAVRFNFRGVGASDGAYDEGRGELTDLLAVLNWARERWPGVPVSLAGFSFGAGMAVAATQHAEVPQVLLVAPPVGRIMDPGLRLPESVTAYVVQGGKDELVDADAVVEWADTQPPGIEVAVLPDADHFFHGQLVVLRETLMGFIGAGQTA